MLSACSFLASRSDRTTGRGTGRQDVGGCLDSRTDVALSSEVLVSGLTPFRHVAVVALFLVLGAALVLSAARFLV